MHRRKIIFVIVCFLLGGLIAGIIFYFISHRKYVPPNTQRDDMQDVLQENKTAIIKQISAGLRILELQGKTSKEKAMILHDMYATSTLYMLKNGVQIEIQIADTPELQSLGLSGRDGLPKKSGLLFVFGQDGYYPFWMKDMLFDIDMIWVNADKKIVHIEHTVKRDSYPHTFSSPELARFVLEIPAGMSTVFKLEKGDMLKWD